MNSCWTVAGVQLFLFFWNNGLLWGSWWISGFLLVFCFTIELEGRWRRRRRRNPKNRWAEPTRLEGPFNRWLVGGVSSSTKDFPVRAVKEKQQQKKTLPKSPTKKKKKKMMMKKEKQKGLAFVWFRSPFSVAARLSASIFFCFCFFFWWLLLHLIDSRLWLVARGRVGGAHLIEIEMWLGSCSYSNLLFKKKKLSLIYSAAIWLHPLHRGSCVVVFFWWKKM